MQEDDLNAPDARIGLCTYISGPCVDGTQAGRRCGDASRGDRCARHGGPALVAEATTAGPLFQAPAEDSL